MYINDSVLSKILPDILDLLALSLLFTSSAT